MYWFIEAVYSFIFMLFTYILLKKHKKWMLSFFFYFFLSGSLICLFILRSKKICSYYDFLELNIDTVKLIIGVSFGVNIVLLIILLITCAWIDKTKKLELAIVGGIRIVPFCSVLYVTIIVGTMFLLFCFIDNIMPQYGLWQVDNQNIQLEKYTYHIGNVTNNEYGYPLWMINDDPLDLKRLEDKKRL